MFVSHHKRRFGFKTFSHADMSVSVCSRAKLDAFLRACAQFCMEVITNSACRLHIMDVALDSNNTARLTIGSKKRSIMQHGTRVERLDKYISHLQSAEAFSVFYFAD